MSVYTLQKMMRDVNRFPARREIYLASKERFVAEYDLTQDERRAFLELDIARLYAMGVHGLLLRPFTIIHNVPEAVYLRSIRGEG